MGQVDGITTMAGAALRSAGASVAAPAATLRSAGSAPAPRQQLSAAAADALALLDDAPLRPTGAVHDALAGGRLLRTGDPAALDHAELVLRTGTIDPSSARFVGNGVNGDLYRVAIADPLDPSAPARWAVEKPAGAQAAQEELGWRLARELGIDHLVPAVARRADGAARIEFRPGRAFSLEGVDEVPRLEQALAKGYLEDDILRLQPLEAAQAARIDRQLLQALDYLLANNDRSLTNGLFDAARGGRLTFIDFGHAGRGQLAHNGGSVLEPALANFQAGPQGGRVALDPVVVEHVRRRLAPARVGELHAAVYDAPGIAGPEGRSIGERFIGLTRTAGYRDGISARLEHLLERGGYTHGAARGDNAGELPRLLDDQPPPVGFAATRAAFNRMF